MSPLPRLVFVRQRPPSFGGAERILAAIVGELSHRGADITIVARSWPGETKGVRVVRCDPPKVSRAFRDTIFARAACRAIAGLAPEGSGAIVQTHERVPCADIYRAGDGIHAAFLAARRRAGDRGLGLLPYHRAVLRLERRLLASPRLKLVVANSRMIADELVLHYDYPEERIRLIPNGIDLARFSPAARERHRDETRRDLGTARDRPVAILIGSGYRRKGLADTMRALAMSRSDAELWVVGRESRPRPFIDLAAKLGLADRVKILDGKEDALPFLAAADILVLPSVYDPFPSAVIEALACGLPAVVTTKNGGREAAVDLDPRLIAENGDVPALSAAIGHAFDLAAAPDTARQARKVAERYDIGRMVDRMIAVYAEVASRSER